MRTRGPPPSSGVTTRSGTPSPVRSPRATYTPPLNAASNGWVAGGVGDGAGGDGGGDRPGLPHPRHRHHERPRVEPRGDGDRRRQRRAADFDGRRGERAHRVLVEGEGEDGGGAEEGGRRRGD